jgi:hypothetical protein
MFDQIRKSKAGILFRGEAQVFLAEEPDAAWSEAGYRSQVEIESVPVERRDALQRSVVDAVDVLLTITFLQTAERDRFVMATAPEKDCKVLIRYDVSAALGSGAGVETITFRRVRFAIDDSVIGGFESTMRYRTSQRMTMKDYTALFRYAISERPFVLDLPENGAAIDANTVLMFNWQRNFNQYTLDVERRVVQNGIPNFVITSIDLDLSNYDEGAESLVYSIVLGSDLGVSFAGVREGDRINVKVFARDTVNNPSNGTVRSNIAICYYGVEPPTFMFLTPLGADGSLPRLLNTVRVNQGSRFIANFPTEVQWRVTGDVETQWATAGTAQTVDIILDARQFSSGRFQLEVKRRTALADQIPRESPVRVAPFVSSTRDPDFLAHQSACYTIHDEVWSPLFSDVLEIFFLKLKATQMFAGSQFNVPHPAIQHTLSPFPVNSIVPKPSLTSPSTYTLASGVNVGMAGGAIMNAIQPSVLISAFGGTPDGWGFFVYHKNFNTSFEPLVRQTGSTENAGYLNTDTTFNHTGILLVADSATGRILNLRRTGLHAFFITRNKRRQRLAIYSFNGIVEAEVAVTDELITGLSFGGQGNRIFAWGLVRNLTPDIFYRNLTEYFDAVGCDYRPIPIQPDIQ